MGKPLFRVFRTAFNIYLIYAVVCVSVCAGSTPVRFSTSVANRSSFTVAFHRSDAFCLETLPGWQETFTLRCFCVISIKL